MSETRFNAYRIMWIMVFFDLPTETKQDRDNATKFRKALIKDGFFMFQYSIYMRHCMSRQVMDVHTKRLKIHLPPEGAIGIISITDKQFGEIELFNGRRPKSGLATPQQLEIFYYYPIPFWLSTTFLILKLQ